MADKNAKKTPVATFDAAIRAESGPPDCERTHDLVRDFVGRQCGALANAMDHEHEGACPCGGASGSGSDVDLIVLIDSSGSMFGAGKDVAAAAAEAIETAKERCGVERLRVSWLTVDNEDDGTGSVPPQLQPEFTHTHQQYLMAKGVPGPFQQDDLTGYEFGEEGADAITDLANFYDWGDGCRAIFYISDTNLEGVNEPLANQQAALDRAVTACQAANVVVFSHFVEPHTFLGASVADVEQTYKDLSAQTGGQTELGGEADAALYTRLLENAICRACGTCRTVKWPEITPCISVTWGDSECDCMESDDHEKLCITLCNCYENVTFRDVTVAYLWLVDEDGKVPATLPDGSPSSRVYPLGPLCFGDIGPCTEDGPTCVSHEAIVINRGAKPGKYKLLIGDLCFQVTRHVRLEREEFAFEICGS